MNKTTNNLIIKTLGIFGFSILSIMFVLPLKANAGFYSAGSGVLTAYDQPTPQQSSGNPVPTVYSAIPNSIELNSVAGNVSIVLYGANFVPGSMAKLNSLYLGTTYNSPNQLTVTLNTSNITTIGGYSITVLNPIPGGGYSNEVFFSVTAKTISQPTQVTNTNTDPSPIVTTTHNTPTKTAINTPAVTTATQNTNTSNLGANAIFASNGFLPSGIIQWLMLLILVVLIVIFTRKAFFEEKNKAVPLKHH